jgi:hypothetical protein
VRLGRRKEVREAYLQHGDEVPDPLAERIGAVGNARLDHG